MTILSIWEKVDTSVMDPPIQAAKRDPEDPNKPKVNWRRRFRIANIAASAAWLLAVTKLALVDVDRMVLERVAPSLTFLVDYRFFVILALLATFILVAKKAFLWLAYIAFFPLVVFFWHIPRLLYMRKSWTLALAVVSIGFRLFRKFKRNFAIRVAESILALIILVSNNTPLLCGAAGLLVGSLVYHYLVALKGSFTPSIFLRSQKEFISKQFTSERLWTTVGIDPQLKSAEVVKFNKAQLEKFGLSISSGLLLVKLVDFYVVLLDRYRRTSAELAMAVMSFVWLFLQSAGILTLANYALWKALPQQFTVAGDPFLLHFAYMSLLSLYGNSISGISPSGTWAVLLSTFAAFYGPLLLVALLLQVIFGYKHSKNEAVFKETAAEMRERKRDIESRLESDYEVSLEEALQRLVDARLGAGPFIAYLARRVPAPSDPGST
ncbi:hypothetical protein [Micromonospora sp. MH99]|uniref:hypothetical protein n=1 Tax=Micromonospora sp. MH99 TaxID=1945510 RepID=UPI001F1CC35B|nr:hypothetical protein [Micromonospora sp. MH99]MCF0091938.1 hypothetical protein [Micromonospora sp. MH99]